MARVVYWNRGINEELIQAAQGRLLAAGNVLADEVRARLRSVAPTPKSRPVYKTGKYSGQEWTARKAGSLLSTIRVVEPKHGPKTNVWVIVGSYRAYYAQILEYAKKNGKPFFRSAVRSARPKIKAVLGGRGFDMYAGQPSMTVSLPHRLVYNNPTTAPR